jgi:hypothetical protein
VTAVDNSTWRRRSVNQLATFMPRRLAPPCASC